MKIKSDNIIFLDGQQHPLSAQNEIKEIINVALKSEEKFLVIGKNHENLQNAKREFEEAGLSNVIVLLEI